MPADPPPPAPPPSGPGLQLPQAGSRLGHFELGAVIARSTRSVVFSAKDSRTGIRAACKLFLEPSATDEAALTALRERLKVLEQIQDPVMPGVLEIGDHDGRPFIAVEWLKGDGVRLDGSQPPLPPSLAARVVERLARALHAAHKQGLVHPALTNNHVLIEGTDNVRLLGLDRPDSPELSDLPAVAVGALPPECAAGTGAAPSVRSNVHSLGVLLYVLLTGSPPFRAATRTETLRLVLEHEAPSPEFRNPLVPRDLATITQRCLALEPGRRPGTAGELAEELGRFLRSESLPATRRPWRQRAAQLMRRHPAATLAAMLLAGGLVAAGIRGLNEVHAWRDEHAALLLEQAAANRLVGRRGVALGQIAEAARIRPDAACRQAAIETLVVPELRGITQIPMREACLVRFSADGSLVAIAGSPPPPEESPAAPAQPVVRVQELAAPRGLGELPWAVDRGPVAFHPTDPWLAVPQPDGTTALWTPRAGQPPVRLGACGIPLFSPDGQRLAIGFSNAVVYVLATLQPEFQLTNATPVCWADDDELLVRTGEGVAAWNLATDQPRPLAGAGQRLLAVSPEARIAAWLIPDSLSDAASVSLRSLADQTEIWRPEGLAPGAVSPPFLFRQEGAQALVGDRLDPSLLRVLDVQNRRHLGSLSLPGAQFGTPSPSPLPGGGPTTPDTSLRKRMPPLDPAYPDRDLASAITRDGRHLAVAIRNPEAVVEVQDLQEGRLLASLAAVQSPVWSPDGRLLAVVGSDSANDTAAPATEIVKIMSLRVPAPNLRLPAPVRQVQIAPDGNRIAAGGRRIDVRYPEGLPLLIDNGAAGPGLVRGPDAAGGTWGVDETLVAGTLPLEFHSSSGETRTLPKNGDLTRLVFAPDGEHLLLAHGTLRPEAAAGTGSTTHFEVWNLWRGKQESVWPAPPGVASGGPVVYSPDGARVASAFFQTEGFDLIDAVTGARGRLLLSGQTDASPATGLRGMFQAARPPMPRHAVRVLRFDRGARRVYAGTAAGWLCGVECATGEVMLAKPVAEGEITALALQSEGDLAAISATDGLVRLCRLPAGEEVARWHGPRTSFSTLEFGPEGRLLAAGSDDGLLQVWDVSALRTDLARLGLAW